MPYLQLPITGSGTEDDPFGPLFPVTVPPIRSIPGFRWSAHIPSNPNGTPQFADCFIWIPDTFSLPGGVVIVSLATARSMIISRDPKANPSQMEQMP